MGQGDIVFFTDVIVIATLGFDKPVNVLTPCSVIVIVDGAIATETKTHFSGGTRAYAFSIAPFNISTPEYTKIILVKYLV